ncbi:hypothetical protein WH47_06686 [Habropoda laboriosa]|uniref:Uncharacterized protein n=1 Tax=Habropoda laboriosa TaxID=597456 RepID=A0A0L7QRS1_9HYME|nr:hypothetical protein WH47_06686 [Habropoda laboriosa]
MMIEPIFTVLIMQSLCLRLCNLCFTWKNAQYVSSVITKRTTFTKICKVSTPTFKK